MTKEQVIQAISSFHIYNNSVADYILFAVAFFILLVAFKLLQAYVINKIAALVKRTKSEIDDMVIQVLQTIKPPFYAFLAFYIALRYLVIEGSARHVVNVILIAWATLQIVLALQVIISFSMRKRLQQEVHSSHKSILEVLQTIITVVLWLIGILFVLSNVGVNITSLVAGLGIGGIAVALAAQNIFSDLFNSIAIYFDQPFVPGDFIIVGDVRGTVVKVGIKTTRIKSLDGEEVIIPNKDIAAARVKNYKHLEERRVSFAVGVSLDTSLAQLHEIPSLVEAVVKQSKHTRFDRAHIHDITDFSYSVRIVYIVTVKSFEVYMDVHQEILLGIREAFDMNGIELAFPTQVVYVNKARK